MFVTAGFDHLEGASERQTEAFDIVAYDRKAAAAFGTFQREGGDDRIAAKLQALGQPGDVGAVVIAVDHGAGDDCTHGVFAEVVGAGALEVTGVERGLGDEQAVGDICVTRSGPGDEQGAAAGN